MSSPALEHLPDHVFSRESFGNNLKVELMAFCSNEEIVEAICAELEESEARMQDELISFRAAVEIVVEAKVRCIQHLRRAIGKLEIDNFFDRNVRPNLGAMQEEYGWNVLCLCLMRLPNPCEYLITDYYIRGVDRPEIVNRWQVRPRCAEQLSKMVQKVLAGER